MGTADFLIREFKNDDYEQLLILWKETGLGGAERGDNLKVIQRCNNQGGKLFVLIKKDTDIIVGTSWITFDGRRMLLHHFGIKPEFQQRGLGKYLAMETMNFLRKKGFQIKLEVQRNNIKAISLYEKLGFQILGDYEVYIIRNPQKTLKKIS
jgi:ribosomal-protein-alanine N-acetyltransferase